MTWRDRLQQGTFRGVRFFTEQASGQAGRRVAVHEYPQQDVYFAEDLGKKAESERLTLFVAGQDYDLARNQLMQALNKPGAGKLVHPYLGTLMIQVTDYDWTISTQRGGYCQFTVQYVRAGALSFPVSISSASVLAKAIDQASQTVQADFAKTFSVDKNASFVEDAARDLLQQGATLLSHLNGQMMGLLTPLSQVESKVADKIDDFVGKLDDYLTNPEALAKGVNEVVSTVFDDMDDMKAVLSGYQETLDTFATDLTKQVNTVTMAFNRQQEALNKAALNTLFTANATLSMAQAMVTQTGLFTTLNEARKTRDLVLAQIDDLIEVGTDQAYEAWADVQTAIMKRIDELEPNLATEATTQLEQSVPALVMAYNLYGDARRELEFIRRNGLPSPCTVPAGVELEVLK